MKEWLLGGRLQWVDIPQPSLLIQAHQWSCQALSKALEIKSETGESSHLTGLTPPQIVLGNVL
jgi:hypothetical protein